jgi:hypothetical protein
MYPLQRPNGLATTHGTKLLITDKSYNYQQGKAYLLAMLWQKIRFKREELLT